MTIKNILSTSRIVFQKIESYSKGGVESFLEESINQDAIIRNLQVLAESTLRLSAAIKSKHPEVDWKAIAGFRNVVVHDYLGLDIHHIWDIVERDMPILKRAILAMLEEA